jgi:hypothetical protein
MKCKYCCYQTKNYTTELQHPAASKVKLSEDLSVGRGEAKKTELTAREFFLQVS